ncbi:hypothetical protein SEA_PAPAYASALAD_43 [Streptomyces phage PapayaSalad]|uniref:Uncharacterized protein n=1 Tax=Streptomyces phage PapayaSalad TaxID=1920310 RepID=A0A1J0MC72_9CAUD|nr:hypothetical protein HOR44_gp38 [Streptomyces phage PapayaSalad]APD18641.1 hypothetical protein SEA_PAPAYASALAD_43 [Streptomyces phage PapayaSalad]
MTAPAPIPAAAVAVIRAVIEDATVRELLHRPGVTAVRAAKALERAGWDLRVIPPAFTPENDT